MSEVKSQIKTPGDYWRKKEEGNLFEKVRVWILRKILSEFDSIDAMNFLLDKMRGTKTNKEFLNSMNG